MEEPPVRFWPPRQSTGRFSAGFRTPRQALVSATPGKFCPSQIWYFPCEEAPPMVVRSAIDRCLAVAYGPVHDLVVERFKPYRALEHEVLDLVELAVPSGTPRRSMRVLDIGCGPGTFTAMLAAAGFSAIGIDRYTPLLDVARETRRSRGLTNISFSRLDLDAFADGEFDQVVSIHSLYVHPDPERMLAHAARVLKPGGHAVFVNHISRFGLRRTFR